MKLKTIFLVFFALSFLAFGQNNILLNPDFENGSENWNAKNCDITVVDTISQSGLKSLLISNRKKTFSGAYQVITDSLKYNGYGKYVVQGYFRTESGEDTAKIKIRLTIDGEKKNIVAKAYVNDKDWSEIKDTLTLDWQGGDLTEGSIFLQTQNNLSLNYFADNLSLVPYDVSGGIKDSTGGGGDTLDAPIAPRDYAQALGKGFDVNWTKTASQASYYSVELLKQIKAKGFRHIRLRTNSESPTDFITLSAPIVKDCLDNGMFPILAFGGQMLEEKPDSTNIANFVKWWQTVAEYYKNYSHRVTFDLLIEISGELKEEPETLNEIYEKTVSAIRESNPTRIIILSPRDLSNPFNLHELKIPSKANGYLMWEWHFYAAGPSKTNQKKLWTTGTPAERKLITDKIDSALAWEKRTGFPSWVGAWMPGNYNGANEYTVPEQTVFASFLARELDKANVPWALNAIQHFNNYLDGSLEWNQERRPVLDAVLKPTEVAFYGDSNYGGTSVRLKPGEYDKGVLDTLGLIGNVKSVMVPADFKVHFYEGENFDGNEKVVSMTNTDVFSQPFNFQSVKIEFDSTFTDVKESGLVKNIPSKFELFQNYPNPFSANGGTSGAITTIRYLVPVVGTAHELSLRLTVYDILGRKVATLVNEKQTPGNYSVQFNASNLPSGIYFYRLQADGFSKTMKMILLK